LFLQDVFHHSQIPKRSEAAAASVQGTVATAQAGSRPQQQAHDHGFADMLNARVVGSQGLPPNFKGKPEKTGNVQQVRIPAGNPELVMHAAMGVQPMK
jgi:hypothetical protein